MRTSPIDPRELRQIMSQKIQDQGEGAGRGARPRLLADLINICDAVAYAHSRGVSRGPSARSRAPAPRTR